MEIKLYITEKYCEFREMSTKKASFINCLRKNYQFCQTIPENFLREFSSRKNRKFHQKNVGNLGIEEKMHISLRNHRKKNAHLVKGWQKKMQILSKDHGKEV